MTKRRRSIVVRLRGWRIKVRNGMFERSMDIFLLGKVMLIQNRMVWMCCVGFEYA